jgi:hypothetical protein
LAKIALFAKNVTLCKRYFLPKICHFMQKIFFAQNLSLFAQILTLFAQNLSTTFCQKIATFFRNFSRDPNTVPPPPGSRNESQFFAGRDLSVAFIQMVVLDRFLDHLQDPGAYGPEERSALEDLAYLYGLSCLERHLPHLV